MEQREAYDAFTVENDVAKGQQFYKSTKIERFIENQEGKKIENTYKKIASSGLIYIKPENNMHMQL